MSRYRIGKQKNKKKIGNTRKLRGGAAQGVKYRADDKTDWLHKMTEEYTNEVKFIILGKPEQSLIHFSSCIAKARAHVEKAFVDCTVDLAKKMSNELNRKGSVAGKVITREIKIKLFEDIKNYKSSIKNVKKTDIYLTSDAMRINETSALLTGESKKYYDNASQAALTTQLEFITSSGNSANLFDTPLRKGEIFISTNHYIPDIIEDLNSIYVLFESLKKGPLMKSNEVTVTAEDIGKAAYDILITLNAFGTIDNIKGITDNILLQKLSGAYTILNFFDKETYLVFEKRLKLIHSLDLFESYYLEMTGLMSNLEWTEPSKSRQVQPVHRGRYIREGPLTQIGQAANSIQELRIHSVNKPPIVESADESQLTTTLVNPSKEGGSIAASDVKLNVLSSGKSIQEEHVSEQAKLKDENGKGNPSSTGRTATPSILTGSAKAAREAQAKAAPAKVNPAYGWLDPSTSRKVIEPNVLKEVQKINISERKSISKILKMSKLDKGVIDAEQQLSKFVDNEQRIKNVIDAVKKYIESKNSKVGGIGKVGYISLLYYGYAINVLTAAKGNIDNAIYALDEQAESLQDV